MNKWIFMLLVAQILNITLDICGLFSDETLRQAIYLKAAQNHAGVFVEKEGEKVFVWNDEIWK